MDDDLQAHLRKLREGSIDSREAIIEQTCDKIHRMVKRKIKEYPVVQKWSTSVDVLQSVLIRLFKSLHIVKPENTGRYYGFVAVQIRRELIDLARKYSGPYGIDSNHESRESDFIESKIGNTSAI